MITSAATRLQPELNPFNEFPDVFPPQKVHTLPPLRSETMQHKILLKNPTLVQKPRPIKPKEKFLQQLYDKLAKEEASGRVYRSQDRSVCAMFMIPKMDKPYEARFLHDLVERNKNTHLAIPNILNQQSILNIIARHPYRSKIDLSDGYH